jgi:serine protease
VRRLQIAGSNGVPASGAAAVVLNVTATSTTAASYLTVWPDDAAQPLASNLNWVAGQTVPNLVEVKLGADGGVNFYNSKGSVNVIADLEGWIPNPSLSPDGSGLYQPQAPVRILDTRNGTGGVFGALGQGRTIQLQVAGEPGSEAAVLNFTVTNPTAASYLTVWPDGTPQPVVSNLNFAPGQQVANRVQVRLGTDGKVDIYNSAGWVQVVADLNGTFTDASNRSAVGSVFTGCTPTRILDTRVTGGRLGPQQHLRLQVAGVAGVPADATAVVANVTATNTTAASYFTVWPDGSSQPLASDLNWAAGETVPNLTVVKLEADGAIDIYNSAGSTDVVVDIVGWYR